MSNNTLFLWDYEPLQQLQKSNGLELLLHFDPNSIQHCIPAFIQQYADSKQDQNIYDSIASVIRSNPPFFKTYDHPLSVVLQQIHYLHFLKRSSPELKKIFKSNTEALPFNLFNKPIGSLASCRAELQSLFLLIKQTQPDIQIKIITQQPELLKEDYGITLSAWLLLLEKNNHLESAEQALHAIEHNLPIAQLIKNQEDAPIDSLELPDSITSNSEQDHSSSIKQSLVNINQDMIYKMAGETIFDRGMGYYKSGKIIELTNSDLIIQAKIEGGAGHTYSVELTFTHDEHPMLIGECNCPHGIQGAFCKHKVAVGLAWIKDYKNDWEQELLKNLFQHPAEISSKKNRL